MVRGLVAQGADWTRGTDAEVRTALEGELDRLGGADPFAALGVDYEADEEAIRAAFLAATKILHPNRFARRDRSVTRVANEVYLRVKDAYYAIAEEDDRSAVLSKLGKGTKPGADPRCGARRSAPGAPFPGPTSYSLGRGAGGRRQYTYARRDINGP